MTVHELMKRLGAFPPDTEVEYLDQTGAMDVERVELVDKIYMRRIDGKIKPVPYQAVEIS
ncbi:MAG: hypothetical protein ACYSUC_11415 [Planctomycetota bacterium]|jgi:hypothetical protein